MHLNSFLHRRTSKQGQVVPFTVIEGPSAWIGKDIQRQPDSYIYHLTEADIKELEDATEKVAASGVKSAEEASPWHSQRQSTKRTLTAFKMAVTLLRDAQAVLQKSCSGTVVDGCSFLGCVIKLSFKILQSRPTDIMQQID